MNIKCLFGHRWYEYHRHNKLFRKCTRCKKREFVCNCLPVEPFDGWRTAGQLIGEARAKQLDDAICKDNLQVPDKVEPMGLRLMDSTTHCEILDKVEKSSCCGASVSVGGEKEGTMFYVCRKCFKPCDIKVEPK
jgi:hypothetical protein